MFYELFILIKFSCLAPAPVALTACAQGLPCTKIGFKFVVSRPTHVRILSDENIVHHLIRRAKRRVGLLYVYRMCRIDEENIYRMNANLYQLVLSRSGGNR